MTCLHGPSLCFVVSPFPPWGVGLSRKGCAPVRCRSSPRSTQKRVMRLGRRTMRRLAVSKGVPHEQTRTPHLGGRGGRVPGGRRDHAPAVPHPAPGPLRRERRQSREEQGFLLPGLATFTPKWPR